MRFKLFILSFFFILNFFIWSQENNTSNHIETIKKEVQEEIASTEKSNSSDVNSKVQDDFSKLLDKELNKNGPESQFDEPKPSWGWQIIKTIIVLIFLISILWGIWKVYIFKKTVPTKESEVFQFLHEYPLTHNKTIKLLLLNNKILVLGLSDAGIQLITEISDPTAINQIILDCEKDAKIEHPDFLIELSKAVKNKMSTVINPHKKQQENGSFNDIAWNTLRSESKKKLQKLQEERNNLHNDNIS